LTELRAEKATEEAFRKLAPTHRFLHLATHGLFAQTDTRSETPPDKSVRAAFGRGDLFGQRGIAGFHPGLLSGIVLAGANQPPQAEHDDGILPALEVGALDLRNVDLVTLSACETGLGQVAGGEGLLGIQRAFQIAGARTTVASLWKVNDDATRALMTEFYKNLWEKKLPRIEALRQAQLAMLNGYDPKTNSLRGGGETVNVDPKKLAQLPQGGQNVPSQRTPPSYWAAFVLSGDWR
jgi:CHAT domain-containing protein